MAEFSKFARRAAADPFFMGYLMAAVQRAHRLDDRALASRLGCGADALPRLFACRPPAPASFRADVESVARAVRCDPLKLAAVIREAEALEALCRIPGQPEVPALLAARDRVGGRGTVDDGGAEGQ